MIDRARPEYFADLLEKYNEWLPCEDSRMEKIINQEFGGERQGIRHFTATFDNIDFKGPDGEQQGRAESHHVRKVGDGAAPEDTGSGKT